MKRRIGVLGLGLIGKQRLDAIKSFPENFDVYVFDPAGVELPADVYKVNTEEEFFNIPLDRIIISTPHYLSTQLCIKALNRQAKVLLEKPMGISLNEAEMLFNHANAVNLNIGFNYRFMPGIIQLKKILEQKKLGRLCQIKFEIGHGGKPEDQTSWKLDPLKAGGGVLIDPGIHIYDLLLYLFSSDLADIRDSSAVGWKGFWNTGIEENVNIQGLISNTPFVINSSVVSWKTKFKVEVIGENSYVEIEGRGRTDGHQVMRYGERWAWRSSGSQKDSEIILVDEAKDHSIESETHAWLKDSGRVANFQDGLAAMKLLDKFQSILKVNYEI